MLRPAYIHAAMNADHPTPEIHVDVQNQITVFAVTGRFSAGQVLETAAKYMTGPQTQSSMWDFSHASGIHISAADLQQLATKLKSFADHTTLRKTALVGSKKINIGLGKMFAAFAAMVGLPYEYKVFSNKTDAIEWLEEH